MLVGNPAEYTMRADDPRVLTGQTHRAYLKIAEGCNRELQFLRDSLVSRQAAVAADRGPRARGGALAAAGVVELNLISQDTVAYGRDLESAKRWPSS